MPFSLTKAIGYGLFIWVILFAVISALVGFKIYANFWAKVLIIAVIAVLVYSFAANAKPGGAGKALGYGAVWVGVGLLLDWLISSKFNANIFHSRSLWAGYLVTLLVPLLQVKFGKSPGPKAANPTTQV